MQKITLEQLSVPEFSEIITQAIRSELDNQPQATPEDTTMTRKELCKFLGVCDTSIWKYLKKGLPVYQAGRKQYFQKSEVLEFMKMKKR